MAVRGGLTRFARPCGAARSQAARSVQLAAPVVEPRSGVLIPPCGEYKRKEPVLSYRLSSQYGGEGGGLTRFARPCGAARLLRARSVQLAAPVVEPRSGVLIPPCGEYKRKKPVLAYELFLKYGGEGGIDSLRSPLRGSPLTACAVCPTGCASCRTPVGGSHPPLWRI
ncbi:Uncharacterised protein [Klebsiella pneumoniae]|nr:Uncharacterised protein [Klebsiella pneumoniae]